MERDIELYAIWTTVTLEVSVNGVPMQIGTYLPSGATDDTALTKDEPTSGGYAHYYIHHNHALGDQPVLVLNNATFENGGVVLDSGIGTESTVYIVLTGNNVITNTTSGGAAILNNYSSGGGIQFAFHGTGSLTATGCNTYAIFSGDSVTVDSTVNITAIGGIYAAAGFTSSGNVEATATDSNANEHGIGITTFTGDITINGGSLIASGSNNALLSGVSGDSIEFYDKNLVFVGDNETNVDKWDGTTSLRSYKYVRVGNVPTTNAATPTITTHPQSVTYTVNQSAVPLTVAASVTDGGTLTYQWYSNTTDSTTGGTLIPDAITNTYTPDTTVEGTTYYYCVVTNTNNGVNGNKTSTATTNAAEIVVNNVAQYNVNITQSANGTIAAVPNSNSAAAGEQVTLTFTPDHNYVLGSYTVTDESGDPVVGTLSGNTFTFDMPASDVNVTATFAAATVSISTGSFKYFDDQDGKDQNNNNAAYPTLAYSRLKSPSNNYYIRTSFNETTNTITIYETATNGVNRMDVGYVPFTASMVVPANTTFNVTLTFNVTCGRTSEGSVTAFAELFEFGAADQSSSLTFNTNSPGKNDKFSSTAYSRLRLTTTTSSTKSGTHVVNITFENNSNQETTISRHFGFFAGTRYAKTYDHKLSATCKITSAVSEIRDYTIDYVLNDGAIAEDTYPISYTSGTTVKLPTNVVKEGHNFDGWYTNDAFSGSPVTQIAANDAGNKIFYAKWTPIEYTITWLDDNDTPLGTTTFAYGATPVYPDVPPTKAATAEYSYTFAGWTPEIDNVIGDATYWATYTSTPIEYTITFITNSDSVINPITQGYGSTVTAPANPGKTGFDFGGWYTNVNLTQPYTFTTMPAENVTLYAKWNPATGTAYTVKHYHQNTSGDGYTLYESETRRGMTDDETAAEAKNYSGFTPQAFTQTTILADGSAVVEIRYDRNTYTVTLITNKGTIRNGNVTEYTYGTATKLPDNVIRSGFYFGGWYDNKECIGKAVTEISANAIGSKTFYAKWISFYIPIIPTINPTYPPVVNSGDNGDIIVTPMNPEMGDTVIFLPAPDAGYEVDEIIVTDMNGASVEFTDNSDGTYGFMQPNSIVTITVTFHEIDTTCPCDDTCPLYPFTDLECDAWYHDGLHFCIENGLMGSTSTDELIFDPNETITRAMIVTILWRLEGSPVVNYLMDFEDVSADLWYTEAIRWAASEKIVEGYGNGKFGTNNPITNEQLATILYRYEQSKGGGFKGMWMYQMDNIDLAEVSDWAHEAIYWMNMNSILNSSFEPKGKATRAEAASMLYKYCEIMSEDNED